MYFFWILWSIDAIISLVFVYFFFIGLSDGTISSYNAGTWVLILSGLASLLIGSYWLYAHQYGVLAKIILFLPAVPCLLYGLFLLLMLNSKGRWN
jgi:hypothetical protein